MTEKFIINANSITTNGTSLFTETDTIQVKDLKLDFHPFQARIGIQKLNKEAEIPKYNKEGDSGFDLVAMETRIIFPGETLKIPTGLAFELPPGLELQLRPRSGLSAKTKLRVILGTCDSNYRGEISVVMDNFNYPTWIVDRETFKIEKKMVDTVLNLENKFESIYDLDLNTTTGITIDDGVVQEIPEGSIIIHKGQRIAQGVLGIAYKGYFTEKEELSETDRGTTGFGASGV